MRCARLDWAGLLSPTSWALVSRELVRHFPDARIVEAGSPDTLAAALEEDGFDIAITSVTRDALQVALVTRADLLPSQPTPFFTDDAYVLDLRVGPPTSKNQCLNGGWQNFTEPPFTSQGQCTNFVSGQP